jgi:short-subunit dehydrogenase
MANQRIYADRAVWITGASSGIGEALAQAFAAAGARLILSARRQDALRAVAARCGARHPVDIVPLDLTELHTLPQSADRVLSRHGAIDVMVHNAAVAHRALAVETPLAVDQRIMATNYFGPIVLTKALLPGMLARKSGQFIVVSSLSGKYGAPQGSAYAASKHALHGFFESLRAEVQASGIRITMVVPGFIRTAITAHALTGSGEEYGKILSLHERAMPAEECAARILSGAAAMKEEVLVGGTEILTVHLKRFFPGLLSRLVRSHPIRTRDRWLARLHLAARKPPS